MVQEYGTYYIFCSVFNSMMKRAGSFSIGRLVEHDGLCVFDYMLQYIAAEIILKIGVEV